MSGHNPAADDELVTLAKNGDKNAMSQLITVYLPSIRFRASRYFGAGLEQDDLIQEGLIGLLGAVRAYDIGRESSFYTFATLCIHRKILSAVQSALSPRNHPLKDYMPLDDEALSQLSTEGGQNPEDAIIANESGQMLWERMHTLLSPTEQEALGLYLSGHSYKEIAVLLCLTNKAVDNALQRVRRKLRSVL